MRKNFGAKPILYPQPVFVIGTYNADGTPNAMTAAWGGISEEKEIMICVDDGHKTPWNALEKGAFTVGMATADTIASCDYVGIVSGNDVPDKVERAGFHAERSQRVEAPIFEELPLCLECRLISYEKESCRLIGEIVNVSADESILNEKGLIDPSKLRPITYDPMNNKYILLGDIVGDAFRAGFSIKNK